MIALTTIRRQVVLVFSAVLILGTIAAADAPGATSRHSSGYRDFLNGPAADPCALPLAQRTGGWVCP